MTVAAQIAPVQAHPFLKWAGGKRQLVPELLKHVPKRYGRYFEPFLGGGALFFALQPAQASLSDENDRLIDAYRAVRSDTDHVVNRVRALLEQHSEKFYYATRAVEPTRNTVARAAWFLYLNRTCFNGLFRVNRDNRFNVPFGRYATTPTLDEANLRACAEALRYVSLDLHSFETVVELTSPGDLVYMDPPYVPASASADFTMYTSGGFDHIDQDRVADVARELKRKKVHIIVSNAGNDEVRKLYRGFQITEVSARRSINSKASKRGPVSEFIIT